MPRHASKCRSNLLAAALTAGFALAFGPGCGGTPPAPKTAAAPRQLVFIEDDFARARDQAKREGKLVFVDGWAPWCHTCLSMQREVLRDPKLAPMAKSFVFVALDTDRDENADFVVRFPVKAWPSFFVLDPVDLRIVGLRGGSMSLDEMQTFLDDGIAERTPSGGSHALAETLRAAHERYAARDYRSAIDLYTRASSSPWARRNEALLGAMRTFSAAKDSASCRDFGLAHAGEMTGSSAPADFLSYLYECTKSGGAGGGAGTDPRDEVLARIRALAKHPPAGSSVDDRADLLSLLSDAEGNKGNATERGLADAARVALLDDAAKKATSPEEARVYDYERMNAYLAVGRGVDAVAMFKERVKQFPESYEAWARLASTLHELKRDAEAKEPIEKAVQLSYGPRRLRYRALEGEIKGAMGDHVGQIAALGEEVAGYAALKPGQAEPDKALDAKRRLDAAVRAQGDDVKR